MMQIVNQYLPSIMRRVPRLILLCVALIALAGCAASPGPQADVAPIKLQAGGLVGQSFVARDDGLDAITLQLAPYKLGTGNVELSLRDSPAAAEPIATASIPISAIVGAGQYRFDLSVPLSSRQADYYFEVGVSGEGSVNIFITQPDTYVDGSLYIQGSAHTGDLVFLPGYALPALLWSWARRVIWWLLVALASAFIFVLPGWALLEIGWDDAVGMPVAVRLCLALGLGVAIAPLPMLWTNAAGLHPGAWHAWLPGVCSAPLLIWRMIRRRPRPPVPPRTPELWEGIALALVAAAVLGVRLSLLSQIEVPLWGDSYQHTMIAQLILDQGGLFHSWAPYVPYTTLTVQYGFPAISAMFAWVMGGDGVSGTLIAGQVINAAAVISLYPLARRMGGDRPWAGVAAVLVAGLLSPLPGYYVNWGRYAQLAGQAALPTVLWLTWSLVEDAEPPWRRAVILGVAIAGMALSYYRMAFLYAPFVLLLLAIVALPGWLRQRGRAIRDIAGLVIAGALTVILFLPWAINVSGSTLSDMFTGTYTASTPLIDVIRADYAAWMITPTLIPWYLLILGALGALASLGARRWMLAAMIPWTVLVASVAAGQLVGLPGLGLMQSFAVIIALYIPISLACGWMFGALAAMLRARVAAAPAIIAAAALALTVVGLQQQATILTPSSIIVTHPDIQAMRWIDTNTPTDARFLVNGFRIYGGRSAVGADAGWWLPLLAHRANTMPPQYAMVNEVPTPIDYTRRIVDLVADLEGNAPGSPVGIRALCANEVTHVYIGQGQGSVGAGARSLIDPAGLLRSPAFQLIYQHDLVLVFKFRRGYCGDGE
jgi:hypothetical protein